MTKHHTLALICLMLLSLSAYGQKLKVGTYTFKDGAIYSGEIENGKPNGKGKTLFKNGDSYEGEYVKGKRQGYASTPLLTVKNMRANGFKTSNMAAVHSFL